MTKRRPRRAAGSRGGGLACAGRRIRLAVREELDLQPLDPGAVGLEHTEAQPVGAHLVTGRRGTPDQVEHVTGDGVVVLVLERRPEFLVEVVDRERAVDPDRRLVDPFDRLVRKVELVLDLADDLLDQVFQRDDALGGPYSSTTIDMCWFVRRNSARSAARSFVSGTT